MKKIRIVALMSAIGLMMLMFFYLNNLNKSNQTVAVEYENVVVAKTEIVANTLITGDMVTVISVPKEGVHANAVKNVEDVVGKMTTTTLFSNEVILSDRLVAKSEDNVAFGLAYVVAEGKRAMSVAVDIPNGVSHLLKVGNHVDIIFSTTFTYHLTQGNEKTDIQKEITSILLQNVKVLSLDKQIDKTVDNSNQAANEYSTVTLELEPMDSAKLAHAINSGTLWMVLRSQGDNTILETTEIILDDLVDKARILESLKDEYGN